MSPRRCVSCSPRYDFPDGHFRIGLGRENLPEYIFVRSDWRGNGIAGALICEGMRYLKEHGKVQARLEVRAVNESALGLYRRLGYEVAGESRFYMKPIE